MTLCAQSMINIDDIISSIQDLYSRNGHIIVAIRRLEIFTI